MRQILAILLAVYSCSGYGQEVPAATTSAVTPASVPATPAPPPSAPAQRSAAELEKLAMPIALHPDPLIAILLPASAYPVEVVQAARFVKDTNNLPLVDQQPWDEKVKALAKFPELIAKMDADLAWTVELGQAFLDQPMDLMNAIQALRAKAQAAGSLKSTPQQVVVVTNELVERTYENQIVYVTNTVIQVQPASTQGIYVPSYNPQVVYVEHHEDEAAVAVMSFGVGMAVGAAIWGGHHCDWHYGGCYYGGYPPPPPPYPPPYPPNRPPPPAGGRPPGDRPGNRPPGNRPGDRPGGRPPTASTQPAQRWQPDQSRLRTSGAPPSAQTREARGWAGAGTQPAQRPATGAAATRPSQLPSGGARPATQPSYNWSQGPAASQQPARSPGASYGQRPASTAGGARPTSAWQQPAANRPAQPASVNRASPSRSSAFSGVNSGSNARSYSSRGAASRGGGGGFRGGGGRGGGRR